MSSIASFVESLQVAFADAGVQGDQCHFDEASGQLVITGTTTRVVPVPALFPQYAACLDDTARAALVMAVTEAFVNGAADIPGDYAECGERLLPQLWPVHKIQARRVTLPSGFELPHCGLHGEDDVCSKSGANSTEDHDLGVVLVCEYVTESSAGCLPPIETPVLSSDLARWGVSFLEALARALENLRSRTKAGPPAEKRWDHHPSGCGQSCQRDRFDSARAALFPKLVATRKRPDGLPEAGGHVVAFATTSCVLATTSKNALGLCFLGDTLHLKIASEDKACNKGQLLSTRPYRLLKMRDSCPDGTKVAGHPLVQKAGEGFVWRWMPYAPGGPPLRSTGEFSVPIDQGEVDSILDAAEAGRAIPVFTHTTESKDASTSERFVAKKQEANALFKDGEYLKSIVAYDAALKLKPSDKDAAIIHANAAQALLKLSAAENTQERREGCAAEAFRRAMEATRLDPSYAKAHARCAAACEILGEHEAAAEARQRSEACASASAAAAAVAQSAKRAELEEKLKAQEARRAAAERAKRAEEERAALLERERAREREKGLAEAAAEQAKTAARLSAMLGLGADLGGVGGSPATKIH